MNTCSKLIISMLRAFLESPLTQKTIQMKHLFLLFLICSWLNAGAQNNRPVCGNTTSEQFLTRERLAKNLETINSGPRAHSRDIFYVPVFFHLVADGTGKGRPTKARALDILCSLNDQFAGTDIRFYLSEDLTMGLFDESISNDNVYSNQSNSFLMESKRHPNAMNIYLVDGISTGGPEPNGVTGYYNESRDWIVLQHKFHNTYPVVISHCVAHFLSLLHTYFGWEAPFDESSPGWPEAPPVTSSGIPTEYQDGTNCSVAGDMICDTPPDYFFAAQNAGCAEYHGGAQDPSGTPVDPMENNIMSGNLECQNYLITPMQNEAMLADLATPYRSYLTISFLLEQSPVTIPDNLLVSPYHNETVAYYNSVSLAWKALPEATHYLISIDKLPNFGSASYREYVTTTNALFLTNLEPGKGYYWQVRPFNELSSCKAEMVEYRKFVTSYITTGTQGLKGVSGWQIQPNPVTDNQLTIQINAIQDFEADIAILDISHRIMFQIANQSIQSGINTIELPVDRLANGLYLVELKNKVSTGIQKLIIARQ